MSEIDIAEIRPLENDIRPETANQRKRWLVAVILAIAPLIVQTVARIFPAFVERFYSRGLYPYIGRSVGGLSGLLPFSLAEFGLVCLVALIPVLSILYLKSSRRRDETWRFRSGCLLRRGLTLGGVILLTFQLMWGLNYGRLPLASTLGFDRSLPNTSELETIARGIVEKTNKYYHAVHEEDPLKSGYASDRVAIERSIEESYSRNRLLPWPSTLSGYSEPKPVLLHDLMARFGVAGMYSPFTGEPNYVDSMPLFDLPATLAHEMAHARGFAREDEADFVSFVICTSSSDPRLKYSGYLSGLRVLSLLAGSDVGRYRETLKMLEDGPRRDLKARYEFWAKYSGKTSYVGNRVNDLYLKANGVSSGVKNYDEATALIVGYFRRLKADAPNETEFARVSFESPLGLVNAP